MADNRRRQRKIIGMALLLGVGVFAAGSALMFVTGQGGSRLLSAGTYLDFYQAEESGLGKYKLFFRRPGSGTGSNVIQDVANTGDGSLPGEFTEGDGITRGNNETWFALQPAGLEDAAKGRQCHPTKRTIETRVLGEGNAAAFNVSVHGMIPQCAEKVLAGFPERLTDQEKAACVAVVNARENFTTDPCGAAKENIGTLGCAPNCQKSGEISCTVSSRKQIVSSGGKEEAVPPTASDITCHSRAVKVGDRSVVGYDRQTATYYIECDKYKVFPDRFGVVDLKCSCEQECVPAEETGPVEVILVREVIENRTVNGVDMKERVDQTGSTSVVEGQALTLYAKLKNGPTTKDVDVLYVVRDGDAFGVRQNRDVRKDKNNIDYCCHSYEDIAEARSYALDLYLRRDPITGKQLVPMDLAEADLTSRTGHTVIRAGQDKVPLPVFTTRPDELDEGTEDFWVSIVKVAEETTPGEFVKSGPRFETVSSMQVNIRDSIAEEKTTSQLFVHYRAVRRTLDEPTWWPSTEVNEGEYYGIEVGLIKLDKDGRPTKAGEIELSQDTTITINTKNGTAIGGEDMGVIENKPIPIPAGSYTIHDGSFGTTMFVRGRLVYSDKLDEGEENFYFQVVTEGLPLYTREYSTDWEVITIKDSEVEDSATESDTPAPESPAPVPEKREGLMAPKEVNVVPGETVKIQVRIPQEVGKNATLQYSTVGIDTDIEPNFDYTPLSSDPVNVNGGDTYTIEVEIDESARAGTFGVRIVLRDEKGVLYGREEVKLKIGEG